MQIAIDGPAGAGKSTIARRLADKLGFVYIDTGAMYRCITWKAIKNEVDLADAGQLTNLARDTHIEFRQGSSHQLVFCDGQDVSSAIRSHEVNAAVSKVASHPEIRRIMVRQQQHMASNNSVVMDGRDIGECVLPEAEYKFFLTASIEERARRRQAELTATGLGHELEKVKIEIEERDKSDANREVGSLKILPDSIVIDSSSMTIDDLMNLILDTIRGSGYAV
ncbi:MAG: (d)CMP kinase [Syntrophomonadaceae bacterium]|nr:(d)CMP kinase [Syntrophomonadaceae bacterium]